MKYKGVKIRKIFEVTPDFKIQKNGTLKDLKPTKRFLGFAFKNGYPYDTKEEVKAVVDKLHSFYFIAPEASKEEWSEIMNGS